MATSKREEMFKYIEVYDTNTQPAVTTDIPNGVKTWFEREIDMKIPFSFRAASRAALQAGKLIPRLSFQVKSPSFFSLRHASIGNETKSPYEWHCRFTIFAVLLATCAVVLCAVQGIFGYPFRKTIALAAARSVPVEGFAYATPTLAHFTPTGTQSTSTRLCEDARVSSLYSQRATSVSRIGRGIFCFPEKGRLLLYNF